MCYFVPFLGKALPLRKLSEIHVMCFNYFSESLELPYSYFWSNSMFLFFLIHSPTCILSRRFSTPCYFYRIVHILTLWTFFPLFLDTYYLYIYIYRHLKDFCNFVKFSSSFNQFLGVSTLYGFYLLVVCSREVLNNNNDKR